MSTRIQQGSSVDANRRYDIPASLEILGISRRRFYAKVRAGEIKLIKDGRRSFTSGSTLIRLAQVPA